MLYRPSSLSPTHLRGGEVEGGGGEDGDDGDEDNKVVVEEERVGSAKGEDLTFLRGLP